jgi:hypothetical protein
MWLGGVHQRGVLSSVGKEKRGILLGGFSNLSACCLYRTDSREDSDMQCNQVGDYSMLTAFLPRERRCTSIFKLDNTHPLRRETRPVSRLGAST